jgi:hypothetical protein
LTFHSPLISLKKKSQQAPKASKARNWPSKRFGQENFTCPACPADEDGKTLFGLSGMMVNNNSERDDLQDSK